MSQEYGDRKTEFDISFEEEYDIDFEKEWQNKKIYNKIRRRCDKIKLIKKILKFAILFFILGVLPSFVASILYAKWPISIDEVVVHLENVRNVLYNISHKLVFR